VLREGRDHRYYVANKPPGYLSAVSDRSHRPLVIELLGQNGRGLHPVGRLDLDSRGLILLTDDGELSFRLQHPRHHVEKEYEVSVRGTPDEAALRRLREGVVLEEGMTGPAEVEILDAGAVSRLRVVIRQGWKRQLRRALAEVGYPVLDLRRTRVGPVQLGRLKEGGYRALNDDEVAALQAATGLVALPGHGAAGG
jgi:pseudouridine synthase